MNTSISDFGLPKSFSKKKKFDLFHPNFIPDDKNKKTYDWVINKDLIKVFFTLEDAVHHIVNQLDAQNLPKEYICAGIVPIAQFTYPVNILTDFPIACDPHNNPIDPEFDEKTLSFNITIRNKPSINEKLHLFLVKIDDFAVNEEEGKRVISDITFRGVINSALQ